MVALYRYNVMNEFPRSLFQVDNLWSIMFAEVGDQVYLAYVGDLVPQWERQGRCLYYNSN